MMDMMLLLLLSPCVSGHQPFYYAPNGAFIHGTNVTRDMTKRMKAVDNDVSPLLTKN
jgi:hypothetical protein